MVINYFQPEDVTRDGVIVIDGEIRRTTGRLDEVGSRVFAAGFPWATDEYEGLQLLVQCERTGPKSLTADITVFGPGGAIFCTHRVADVPLAAG